MGRKRIGHSIVIMLMFLVIFIGAGSAGAVTLPKNVTGFRKTAVTASTVTLKWNSASYSDGYNIYNSSGKIIKTVKGRTNTTAKIYNLSPATTYKYYIRAYRKVNGKTYRSPNRVCLSITTTPKAVRASIIAMPNRMKISWGRTACSGYRVYRKPAGGSYKCIATVGATAVSYTDKNASAGVKYTYKVRAFATGPAGNSYGSYSNTVTRTAPKAADTMSSSKAKLLNSVTLTPRATGDPELDALVKKIIDSVTTGSMTKAEKLKACYDYLINNFTFGFPDTYYGKYTVYHKNSLDSKIYRNGKDSLFRNKGTCYGFSCAFTILARRLGFKAVIQEGGIVYTDSLEYQQHYWVNIKLGSKWYLFDPQVEQCCKNSAWDGGIRNWCWVSDLYYPDKLYFGSFYEYSNQSWYWNNCGTFAYSGVYKN
ncbi:MAG: transglutaminase domain-containing protein [Clostridia bacterium]|nr:transglutaminase domain-containing protein [Clostridia bacterium]